MIGTPAVVRTFKSLKSGEKKISEEEARKQLKAALDSWVFGDSHERFNKNNPQISVFTLPGYNYEKLLRYEIGATRATSTGFEFALILIYESKAGTEIKKGCNCTVSLMSDKWWIAGR